MTLGTSNTTGRQQPLGDLSLNYSEFQRGDIVNDRDSSVSGLKIQNGARTEVRFNPQLQASRIPSRNINCTPNHRRSGGRNAPFKSPITLCFDRMLGAGKFCRR